MAAWAALVAEFEAQRRRRVVFVTGAGMSVGSGVPPYRGETNAVWDTFVLEWGTRAKFEADPLQWWNKFWLRTHEKPEYVDAPPNLGHAAIAHIAAAVPSTRVVTQNVDALHVKSLPTPCDALVEVHGRLGLYRCSSGACPNAAAPLTCDDISLSECSSDSGGGGGGGGDDDDVDRQRGRPRQLSRVPLCPLCGAPAMPLALLFDEDYDCHPFFQIEKARSWLSAADALVFVGTSFSVGICHEALRMGVQGGKAMYSLNVRPASDTPVSAQQGVGGAKVATVLGRCEETLPLLAASLDTARRLRQLEASIAAGDDPSVAAAVVAAVDTWSALTRLVPQRVTQSGTAALQAPGAAGHDEGLETLEMTVGTLLAELGTPHRRKPAATRAWASGGGGGRDASDGDGDGDRIVAPPPRRKRARKGTLSDAEGDERDSGGRSTRTNRFETSPNSVAGVLAGMAAAP